MGLLRWKGWGEKEQKAQRAPDKSEAIQMIHDWAHKLTETAQDLEENLEKAREQQGLTGDQGR